jgi:hypothetical protein
MSTRQSIFLIKREHYLSKKRGCPEPENPTKYGVYGDLESITLTR